MIVAFIEIFIKIGSKKNVLRKKKAKIPESLEFHSFWVFLWVIEELTFLIKVAKIENRNIMKIKAFNEWVQCY